MRKLNEKTTSMSHIGLDCSFTAVHARVLCLTCALAPALPGSARAAEARWVYVPERATEAQLQKGDLVLKGTNGFLAPIMHSLNHAFGHVAVAIDDEGHVREVTVDEKAFKTDKNFYVWSSQKFTSYLHGGLVKFGSKRFELPSHINPVRLANLKPGFVNHGTDHNDDGVVEDVDIDGDGFITGEERELEVYGAGRCIGTRDGVQTCKNDVPMARLTTRDESKRARLHAIADAVMQMRGPYIINAFMNMERFEPTEDFDEPDYDGRGVTENGSMCSGAIWWADRRTRDDGGEMNIGSYEPEVLRLAAENMYAGVYHAARQMAKRMLADDLTAGEAKALAKTRDSLSSPYIEFASIILPYAHDILKAVGRSYTKFIVEQYAEQVRDWILESHDFPRHVANQVINAFLFNRFDDTSSYWRDHVDELSGNAAVAPDHLLAAIMPNPLGGFTGLQTEESSPYDLIEDFKTSGGYYTKLIDGDVDVPVDPRTGEPPHIRVYENSKDVHVVGNGGDVNLDFEIIPMPEEFGGRPTLNIEFSVMNEALYSPLELVGDPVISTVGDSEFSVLREPMLSTVPPGARTLTSIAFSPEPSLPGSYATAATIPNNGPVDADYWMRLNVNLINKAYFIDHPVFYNQCDDIDDMHAPLVGAQFDPSHTIAERGGYTYQELVGGVFDSGYGVRCRSRRQHDYSLAIIYPFAPLPPTPTDESLPPSDETLKPHLPQGTVAFWAVVKGDHRDDDPWVFDGGNMDIHGTLIFYLTDSTYVTLNARSDHTPTVSLTVDGAQIHVANTDRAWNPYVLQWDLEDGFADGSNVRLHNAGNLHSVAASMLSEEDVRAAQQRFWLRARTSNGGDRRGTGYAYIDNITIYNSVIDAAALMNISSPKVDLD